MRVSRWRVHVQEQPGRVLRQLATKDKPLYEQLMAALAELTPEHGFALDPWGDLRRVEDLAPGVDADFFVTDTAARELDVRLIDWDGYERD